MMKTKTAHIETNKPLSSTELIFLENVVLIFLVLIPAYLFLIPFSIIRLIILLILIYVSSFYLIRRIYFYNDHLIIYYPTRFILRKKEIFYSTILKVKYVHSKSAYALPEIQIKLKNKLIPIFYLSTSYKNRKEVLSLLNNLGLKVEIRSQLTKDKKILNNFKTNKTL